MTFGKSGGGGRRRAPRAAAPLLAVYTTVSKSHEVVLVDVSNTGARLSGPNLPEAGEQLFVSVENIRAFGTVVWVEVPQFAVEFDTPLSPDDLGILTSKVKQGMGFSPEERAAIEGWILGVHR